MGLPQALRPLRQDVLHPVTRASCLGSPTYRCPRRRPAYRCLRPLLALPLLEVRDRLLDETEVGALVEGRAEEVAREVGLEQAPAWEIRGLGPDPPSSAPRQGQIQLRAASSLGQPPSIGRCVLAERRYRLAFHMSRHLPSVVKPQP